MARPQTARKQNETRSPKTAKKVDLKAARYKNENQDETKIIKST